MRVYVPLTFPLLRAALAAGELPAGRGYGVTPGLREHYASGDAEELEEAARALAAVGSLRLLAADASAPRRRVVVAIDADGPADPAERGAVQLAPVSRKHWAAALLDDDSSADVIAAAADAVTDADAGDEDAAFMVSEADDIELQWFGVQELEHLPDL
ncbi:MAG TPA: hypothetical protein VHE83_04495 [Mycobacteriales bacterium]|nr:hypothetical protein [Mycobacteriales bacterium]